jgi:hypothetical protein
VKDGALRRAVKAVARGAAVAVAPLDVAVVGAHPAGIRLTRMRWKQPLHPMDTVMEATAHSRVRYRPIIQAMISPRVA